MTTTGWLIVAGFVAFIALMAVAIHYGTLFAGRWALKKDARHEIEEVGSEAVLQRLEERYQELQARVVLGKQNAGKISAFGGVDGGAAAAGGDYDEQNHLIRYRAAVLAIMKERGETPPAAP